MNTTTFSKFIFNLLVYFLTIVLQTIPSSYYKLLEVLFVLFLLLTEHTHRTIYFKKHKSRHNNSFPWQHLLFLVLHHYSLIIYSYAITDVLPPPFPIQITFNKHSLLSHPSSKSFFNFIIFLMSVYFLPCFAFSPY